MQIERVWMPADMGAGTLLPWIEVIERADRAGVELVMLGGSEQADPLDGLAVAAWCAGRTRAIRLCAVIDPDTVEPFTLARGLATLDHLSGGRSAWRLAGKGDAARSAELAHVVSRLLASWSADAVLEDAAAGRFSDPEGVASIDHDGDFFSVRGPLNIPRPPQGAPLRVALPGDPGAEEAEILIEDRIEHLTIDQAREILA